jgi:rubrerythrin
MEEPMLEDVTVAKCLEFAVETEEIGAELYRRLAGKFSSDREISELFEGLGRDEEKHGEQFRLLRDQVLPRFRDHEISPEQQNYVRAMSMSAIFSGDKGLAKGVEGIKTREDALERALGLEKATLSYYQAVREITGADDILDALIAVEKKHVVKVMQLMVTGAKFRGLADSY